MSLIRLSVVRNVLLAGAFVVGTSAALAGNGNGGGNGNANSHANNAGGNSQVANAGGNSNNASKLGALNAAHASAQAFAHASPNSRVGKIKAYYVANAAAKAADAKVLADRQTLIKLTADLGTANTAVTDAQTKLDADTLAKADAKTLAADQVALDLANTNAQLAQSAYDTAASALKSDQAAAATLDQSAVDALANAGNKPLDAATKQAFDSWLASMANKFN